MKEIFRNNHLRQILMTFEKENIPLDIFLSNYFRKNKAIGSKDRKIIAQTTYFIIRWKGLIDFYTPSPITWEKRILTSQNLNLELAQTNQSLPEHVRVSFPKKYFDKIKESHGQTKALEISLSSNTEAPTTIRANSLKITRDNLFAILKEKYDVSKCKDSKDGIIFHKKINFFASEEFKKGFFEVQDEGSQLIADLLNPTPNSLVLDYCAGSGGKTLAFAHKMKNKGQIFLHDVRGSVLLEAKKRLKRAGIQNAQIVTHEEIEQKIPFESMDWILLDVPCSGSGTLRRNPDMKWKFDLQSLSELIDKQKNIFNEGIKFLKTKGHIIYSTCSIFKDENEKQIEYFLNNYPLKLIKTVSWLPEINNKDGFFGAIFKKI